MRRPHPVLSSLIVLTLVFVSCATPPEPVLEEPAIMQAVPESEALPELRITEITASALDQHRTNLTVTSIARNPRSKNLILAAPTLKLALPPNPQAQLDAYELGTIQAGEGIQVPAFGESSFTLRFEMDTRKLDQDIPGFRELSTAGLRAGVTATAERAPDETGQPDSGLVDLYTQAEAQVPLIREPELRIIAINLVKHELINVILEVVLEVRNPNAFALEFDQLAYDFFGEGRRWARGREHKTLLIPARDSTDGTASTKIPVTLNFTDMDRSVFDLVEKLQVVRYRLGGTATVRTGLDFLPEFTMAFDQPGAVKVERTLRR